MCFAGLRFSDIQRLDLASISSSEGRCRGRCWRTNSRRAGVVWGALERGCLNAGAGSSWKKGSREKPQTRLFVCVWRETYDLQYCSGSLSQSPGRIWPDYRCQCSPAQHPFLEGNFANVGKSAWYRCCSSRVGGPPQAPRASACYQTRQR